MANKKELQKTLQSLYAQKKDWRKKAQQLKENRRKDFIKALNIISKSQDESLKIAVEESKEKSDMLLPLYFENPIFRFSTSQKRLKIENKIEKKYKKKLAELGEKTSEALDKLF